jgi:4-hydroxyphenylpyruvate dioxygenase
MAQNEIGLVGIEFIEFSTKKTEWLSKIFFDFGFSLLKKHSTKNTLYFNQNDIHFFLNSEPNSFGGRFAEEHGHSVSSMGWRFQDAAKAHKIALQRGAKDVPAQDKDFQVPAIFGIGDSIIYFLDKKNPWTELGFKDLEKPVKNPHKGFLVVDHLTNNVYKGTMENWRQFYKGIFEFTDVRYFDIKGEHTGLTSHALRSPDGSFCIPINEADEHKSQINEYLDIYNGPGVQHIAFLTEDILSSLKHMENSPIQMLDIEKEYYQEAFKRVPTLKEDKADIQKRHVLVDGDEKGYLLQIFTKDLIGPIFIELIQRRNNLTFGEGNFQALFKSIEREQEKRGVFKT